MTPDSSELGPALGLELGLELGLDHAAAREYAVAHHGDQRYGDRPYVAHLDEVAALVEADPFLATIAYLHDVIEDTPVTRGEVLARFGLAVADAVELLSDPPGRDRAARKHALHARFAQVRVESVAGRAALIVKTADRLANVRACLATGDARLQTYAREHAPFRESVHREGLCDGLWAELDGALGARA